MPKATLRRDGTRMLTLGCRFHLSRDKLAQIVSHGLYWRPSFKDVQYESLFVSHLGRKGIESYARMFVRDDGLWQIGWKDQEGERQIEERAYELVDLYFPDFR